MSTNIAIATAAAATAGGINFTFIIALVTVCLTAMATLVTLFRPKQKISDEILRVSPYLKKLEMDIEEKEEKLDGIRKILSEQHTEVEKLKVQTQNGCKSLEELKQDNRDLVQRLDQLLKQFMEYMEG